MKKTERARSTMLSEAELRQILVHELLSLSNCAPNGRRGISPRAPVDGKLDELERTIKIPAAMGVSRMRSFRERPSNSDVPDQIKGISERENGKRQTCGGDPSFSFHPPKPGQVPLATTHSHPTSITSWWSAQFCITSRATRVFASDTVILRVNVEGLSECTVSTSHFVCRHGAESPQTTD